MSSSLFSRATLKRGGWIGAQLAILLGLFIVTAAPTGGGGSGGSGGPSGIVDTNFYSAGTIGSGGTASCNMSATTGCKFTVGAGSFTVANPTNAAIGTVYWLEITYTAFGGVTDAWGTNWKTYDIVTNNLHTVGPSSLISHFSNMTPPTTIWIPWHWDGANQIADAGLIGISSTVGFFSGLTSGSWSGGSVNFNADGFGFSSVPRMPLRFDEGRETALTANESLGTFKIVKAMTIQNIELDIKVVPTCSVSEVITCYDCGASAGACTSGQTATLSTTTIATGATRQSVDQTVTTANVAAGEYVSCIITAGTCTVSDNSISMMAVPQ